MLLASIRYEACIHLSGIYFLTAPGYTESITLSQVLHQFPSGH